MESNYNNNWDIKQANISRQPNFTELIASSTSFQTKSISGNVIIEFDYYCTNTNENGISIRNGGNAVWQRTLTQLGVAVNTWGHVKIKLSNGEYWLWVDDINKTSMTHTINTYDKFAFRVSDGYSVRYKNFIICELQ